MDLHSATRTWTSASPLETSQPGAPAFHQQDPSIADLLCLCLWFVFVFAFFFVFGTCQLLIINPYSEGLDCIKIIEELSERVKRMVGMRNVVAITSAKVHFPPSSAPCLIILQRLIVKLSLNLLFSLGLSFSPHNFAILQVPIVKLIHQQCQIEADLSLYNVLARENTCLLSLYSGDF